MRQGPAPTARFQRLVFRLSKRIPVAGFDVRATLPTVVEARLIEVSVRADLDLLRKYAPHRYDCLRRDLPCILVGASSNLAECYDRVGLCIVSYDYVVDRQASPAEIALCLVHEGTHARLARYGFGYDEGVRARIERLCMKAELILATRLPDGAALVVRAHRRMEAWSPEHVWTDTAVRERGLNALSDLGAAGKVGYWIGGALRWLDRKRPDHAA